MQLLRNHNIDLVFDVGANIGQYAEEIISNGYSGKVVSIEPMLAAYNIIKAKSEKNINWDTFNIGLGNANENLKINVANNSASSSILPMHNNHSLASDVKFEGEEIVTIQRFDDFLEEHNFGSFKKKFIKIDTQGYEFNVLQGAEKSLNTIDGIQLEMSLFPLYDGEMLFPEMLKYLIEKGFSLYSLEPGFSNHKSGQLLQVDGVFFRNKL